MMQYNVVGMLTNAARCISAKNDVGGYRHTLRELASNLQELHDRWKAGDTKVVDEFFALYVVDKAREKGQGA